MSVGLQTPIDVATDYLTTIFAIKQVIGRMQTLAIVEVLDCTNDGGIVPAGTVTVRPMVNLMTGERIAIENAPIFNVPYSRVMGGRNAVIIDPQPGDQGLAGFCSRDISAVKETKGYAPPGSFRQFDIADAVYLFTIQSLQAPDQYVVMHTEGVDIVSPQRVTIQAPVVRIMGELQQSNGDASFGQSVDVAANVTVQGEVTAGNIPLTTHKHPTAAPGPPSPPIP